MDEIVLQGPGWKDQLRELLVRIEWTRTGIRLDGRKVKVITPEFSIDGSGAFLRNGEPPDLEHLGKIAKFLPAAALTAMRDSGATLAGSLANRYERALLASEAAMEQMRADLIEDIRTSLYKALANGESFAEWKKGIRKTLVSQGWSAANPGEASRITKTTFDTSMRASRAAAQVERIAQHKDFFPYIAYEASTATNRRADHIPFYGLVLRADDPFWSQFFPPSDWGCQCHARSVTESEANALGISQSPPAATPVSDAKFPYKPASLSRRRVNA